MQSSIRGNRSTEGLQTLEDALSAAEQPLDGPPPLEDGPRKSTSFRAWIERATQAQHWPPLDPHIDSRFWQETKKHVTSLMEQVRFGADMTSLPPDTAARLNDILRCYLEFGALYSLNYLKQVDPERDPREPQYELSAKQKEMAVQAVVEGWTIPDSQGECVPGLLWLLLNDREFAGKGFTSLNFYFTYIDYYLQTVERGLAAEKPAILRPHRKIEPSIVTENVWVRFMIRYHRREVTIRDSLLGLLRRSTRPDRNGPRGKQEFWALRGIDLVAHPGDVIGIIGRNGAGKTSLLKSLAGILAPDRGRLSVRGRVGCLLSFGVGFNANLSGKENIYLNGSILGLSEKEIDRRLQPIIEFCELGEFINAPVRTYSAGMRGRLGFSIAIHIDPDVLILDEVLSVGDAYFRDKAGSIVDRFKNENKTVIIASHSMDLIRKVCTKALWLDQGKIRLEGGPSEVTRAYVEDCRQKRSEERE